jgi:hypothetical protein
MKRVSPSETFQHNFTALIGISRVALENNTLLIIQRINTLEWSSMTSAFFGHNGNRLTIRPTIVPVSWQARIRLAIVAFLEKQEQAFALWFSEA